MLTVYEQLFLLAIDEEKGNFLAFTKKTIPFGLAGAILAELALQGAICLNEKHRLEIANPAQVSDELLKEVIQEIQTAEKPRKLSFWVTQLKERPKKLRTRVGESMAEKNLVLNDESRFHWPAQNAELAENGVQDKFNQKIPLRAAVFASEDPDPRSLALLNIVNACGLLGLVFTEDEAPIARRLVHEKVIHAALINPSLQTIEEIAFAIEASIEDETE